ncbi:hypothetical protein CAPTEDRAFT_143189 [Capitella teleta]|uniref:Trimethyllysine dioxygenase, mitochondrial n=1 Tax=Capitella teleta TaxID=283909 RepID=R7U304_CAPTE|nr:hypothetical protein CAPTEDRAFT_143189 [Capitella teleta]|eukprot:ELT97560.1 hypothetical protein CAPTEDRAFT_143189 [Capitella teleta]
MLRATLGTFKPRAIPLYLRSRSLSTTKGQSHSENVQVTIGQKNLTFNSVWLRENCRSAESYNAATKQRNVLHYTLSQDQTSVQLTQQDSEQLSIQWKDGHSSEFPLQWLIDNSYPGSDRKVSRLTWLAEDLKEEDLSRVDYKQLIGNDEESMKVLLTSLLKYGIGIVEGVPANLKATQETVEKVSFIQETFFGGMWQVSNDMPLTDTAYTNLPLGVHIDTTYLAIPCGIQVFHCIHHDGTGGETLLVDGFRAAEDLRAEDPKKFDLLTRERVEHHFKDPDNYVQSLDSVLKVEPHSKDLEMVRYNHYDRSPIKTIPQDRLDSYYEALGSFSHLITRPNAQFKVKLHPGTCLFVDNWRVLHGRTGFTGSRKLCGAYLPRDEWLSKARTMGLM